MAAVATAAATAAAAAASAAAATLAVVAAAVALVLHVFLGAVHRVRNESAAQLSHESSATAAAVGVAGATAAASAVVAGAARVTSITAGTAIALAFAAAGLLAMFSECRSRSALPAFAGTTRFVASSSHYIYNKYFISPLTGKIN